MMTVLCLVVDGVFFLKRGEKGDGCGLWRFSILWSERICREDGDDEA